MPDLITSNPVIWINLKINFYRFFVFLVSSNKFEQLKLALAWNRLDIAKSDIFSDQSQVNAIEVMTSPHCSALIG